MFNRLSFMAITLLMVSSLSANGAEAPKLLTADEYYKIGLKDFTVIVEACKSKDLAAGDIMGLMMPDERIMFLSQACMNPEQTVEVFPLYQSYMRGAKKALEVYKPHQKLQDALITYLGNYIRKVLVVSDYAAIMTWQQTITAKMTENMLEGMLLLYAEVSSD